MVSKEEFEKLKKTVERYEKTVWINDITVLILTFAIVLKKIL